MESTLPQLKALLEEVPQLVFDVVRVLLP